MDEFSIDESYGIKHLKLSTKDENGVGYGVLAYANHDCLHITFPPDSEAVYGISAIFRDSPRLAGLSDGDLAFLVHNVNIRNNVAKVDIDKLKALRNIESALIADGKITPNKTKGVVRV